MDKPVFNTPVTYWLVSGESRIPVTDLFDIDGERTTDPKEAWGCVALLPSGKFIACYCDSEDLVVNGGH